MENIKNINNDLNILIENEMRNRSLVTRVRKNCLLKKLKWNFA